MNNIKENKHKLFIKFSFQYILLFLFLVISIKFMLYIFNRGFNINIMNFDFNDLLSLILAIFAILLASLFYFQATKTSNNFYDNVYKFTKDTTEILSRIEERFGEKLLHLEQGYNFIQEHLIANYEKVKVDLNTDKEKIDVLNSEQTILIKKMIESPQEDVKKEIEKSLTEKIAELNSVKEEFNKNFYELNKITHKLVEQPISDISYPTLNFLIQLFLSNRNENIYSVFENNFDRFPNRAKNEFNILNWIDSSNKLIEKGYKGLDRIEQEHLKNA